MTAKELFRRVRIAEREIKLINAKLAHYEDLGLSVGGINSNGPSGNAHRSASRVEIAACGAVDALSDLDRQKRDLLAILSLAEHVIGLVTNDKYRRLLSYRYLCGWSFKAISDELEYSDPNSVYRAHGWALAAANRILQAEEQKKEDRG